mmetsp:Transcript_57486/g.171070  ORF Transcript_57486/g.171070 Transcript_57486/m.171070 type:complete len:423 (-) Transcript_57486:111-1379(-)
MRVLDRRVDEDARDDVRESVDREEHEEDKDHGVAPVDLHQGPGDFHPADATGHRHEERVDGRAHGAEELDEVLLDLRLLPVVMQVHRHVLGQVHREEEHVHVEEDDGPDQRGAGAEHRQDHHAQLPEEAEDAHEPQGAGDPQHAKQAHGAEAAAAGLSGASSRNLHQVRGDVGGHHGEVEEVPAPVPGAEEAAAAARYPQEELQSKPRREDVVKDGQGHWQLLLPVVLHAPVRGDAHEDRVPNDHPTAERVEGVAVRDGVSPRPVEAQVLVPGCHSGPGPAGTPILGGRQLLECQSVVGGRRGEMARHTPLAGRRRRGPRAQNTRVPRVTSGHLRRVPAPLRCWRRKPRLGRRRCLLPDRSEVIHLQRLRVGLEAALRLPGLVHVPLLLRPSVAPGICHHRRRLLEPGFYGLHLNGPQLLQL